MYRHTTAIIAILLVIAAVLTVLPARRIAAAPRAVAAAVTITAVSELNPKTNERTIQLSTGETLRVEIRIFDTYGAAPTRGPISDFHDQRWLPILGYYGYATFTQHDIHYHAKR
jgi:hypothetical protein